MEAVPRPWLTFNLAQKHQLVDKIAPRSADTHLLVFVYSPPRRPSVIRPTGGFRFVGPRIQFRDYLAIFSIAISVNNCSSTKREMHFKGSLRRALNGPGASRSRTAHRVGPAAQPVVRMKRSFTSWLITCGPSLGSARHGAFSTHQHGPAARAMHPTGPR